MSDPTPEQIEIERLRTHNAALLDELKGLKADNKRLGDELTTAHGERDAALAQVESFAVGDPVKRMLDDVSPCPDLMKHLLDREGYTFARENGAIVMRDRDSNIPKIMDGTTERDMAFTAADLWAVLGEPHKLLEQRSEVAREFAFTFKAPAVNGGGAGPSHGRVTYPPAPTPAPTPTASPALGIR
ncbi:hypothetical protein [Solilutibacter silvestris]|uniref:Uncharacterized protein n=1 Tax=Solilutibacter silvestris TaxID=1645665 RepID=A0A2K1PYG5_9GAMM|nr:hypothetical protein [Lysobacter silvestris]PNS07835.1 hypothetical protein Lysil_2011 [Lysobacter silvestris]